MQVNWNWLYQYSPTAEKFVDLRDYSNVIDLTQWSDAAKNACIVGDSLQAVPISMTGRIFYWNMNTFKAAGIFEWDSAANKYYGALEDASGFTVGEEIKFGDKANGGFSKVSMCMAITTSCQHPVEAAALIDFLWNGEGAAIIGSECGIPASAAGLAAAQAADAVKPLVLEANTKVLAFVDFPLDPYFESSKLKDTTEGVYTDVFDGFSYGEYSAEEAAGILLDGVTEVLNAA